MGWGQEACDAECAGLARALQVASGRLNWGGHHLLGCASGHREDDHRRTGTRARPGGTLPPSESWNRTPRSRSAGARVAKEPRATRWQTSGSSSPPTSRTPMGWSGSQPQTQTAQSERESSPSRGRWPMSSEGSPSRSWQTPRAGRGKTCQDQQPEVPARRESETRPHGGQGQEAPRGPLLPVENGTLSDRSIPHVDDATPRTQPVGGANITPRPGTTYSNTVPDGKTSKGRYGTPSQQRPASSPDPPGSGTKPASRNCSPISGAARRS